MPCGRKPASLLASSAEKASASGRLVAFGRVGLAVPVDATAAVVVQGNGTGRECGWTILRWWSSTRGQIARSCNLLVSAAGRKGSDRSFEPALGGDLAGME